MSDTEIPAGLSMPAHLQAGIARFTAAAREQSGSLEDVVVEDPWIESEEQAAERRARQIRLKQARWLERLPEDYAHASLDDFDEDLAATLRRAYHDDAVRNIVLAGPVDAGKTHAAYAIGRLAVEQNSWVEAWSVFDLMKQVMPSGDDPALMERRAKGCFVLILDDLGASKASEFAIETLTAILGWRVAHRRRTIITTNATEEQLAAVWGARLMSRMRHGLVAVTMPERGNRKPAW